MEEAEWLSKLEQIKATLLKKRGERIRPSLDDKQLLGWNALMNIAFSQAYAALGDETYKEIAIRNMSFLEDKFYDPLTQTWNHTYKVGKAMIPAFLDDLAYLIQAYIFLQEITGEGSYLLKAKTLLEQVNREFGEEETGYYFYTKESQTDVIVRKKEVYDGATPSGNAIMAINLQYLGRVFDQKNWLQRMEQMTGSLSQAIVKYPTSFGIWALVIQGEVTGWKEVALMGQGARQYLPQALEKYSPYKILQCAETKTEVFPLLAGKMPENGGVLLYVCQNFTCSDYTTDKIVDFLAIV